MRWGTTTAVVALAVCGAQQAYGQTVTRYDFDVAAGPRRQVIQTIAGIAGADVSFADAADKGLDQVVGPVRGNLTLAQALREALAGSKWFVETAGNGQVRIARSGGNADIIVTGRRDPLRKEDSNLLTRSDTPLKDTPGTIVSVTQSVLATQNTTSLNEAIRNLPGVTYTPGPPSQISSRGDSTRGASFTNGLRNSIAGGDAPTIDVESIEVLKGPSSVLTGTSVAGGLVNLNPKRATGTSLPQFDFGVGSNDYIRGSVDVGGTISESDRLYWRFVGLSEHADRQSNGGQNPHSYAASAIFGYRDNGWKIDASSQVYDTRIVYGKLYYADPTTNTVQPVTIFSNDNNYYKTRSLSQNLGVERDLVTSEAFTLRLRSRMRYQYAEQTLQNQLYQGKYNFGGAIGIIDLVTGNNSFSKNYQFSSSSDLYAKLETGSVTQQFIVAFDYSWQKINQIASGYSALVPFQPLPSLGSIPDSSNPNRNELRATRKDYGLVVQDQISWGPFHALLSARQTWYDLTSRQVFYPYLINNDADQRISKLLPTGGLVFSATKWASIYYTYQKAVTPPNLGVRTYRGAPFPAAISTGHEAGVKLELFGGRLSVTGDYFRKDNNNYPLIDPAHPGFYIPGPGQKSEGFEINQSGKITPTLFLQSGFAYTTSRSATPLVSAPRYQANAWLLKSFTLGDRQQLDIGFGGNYQSNVNLVKTDSLTGITTYPKFPIKYVRFDAAVGYTYGPYKLNLTVNNLFDRFNIYTPLVANSLYQGVGREFRLVFTAALPKSR
ncbi:TonB-dependent receptor [Sphingobium fuliginis]|uniref:TonB-dependent siderophore receptor n=1 Tax=Sphingobium fuliginis (strain ATCC 27551) TaxID=336203 RepID=UPI00101EC0AA|nr:TonB-dependent receptor [Sphingobium fuliginis]RYL96854.1 TonB-dependent receptor [Sphingobium fuliginis]